MKFAKLFDIDESTQVLVQREIDEKEEEAPYRMKVSTDYDGIFAAFTYSFKHVASCDLAFENYDLTTATNFHCEIVKAIELGE